MARFRGYLVIWLLLAILIIICDNYRSFGLEKLAKKINGAFAGESRVLIIDDFTLGEEPATVTLVNTELKKGERSWLTGYLSDGSPGLDLKEYQVDYDPYSGAPVNYRLVREIKNAVAMVPNTYIKGAKAEIGAFFNPRFSRYGVNCNGCRGQKTGHGNFAVGIGADVVRGVRQFSGKYEKGITFEDYYIVAADPTLPFCAILEISNHNFKGGGLKPGEPFYAVVLDRGGAIKNNRLDFYIGDERYYNDLVKYSGRRRPVATIVAYGKRARDKGGQRSCKVPDIGSLKENAEGR